jgi:hypothetical protein
MSSLKTPKINFHKYGDPTRLHLQTQSHFHVMASTFGAQLYGFPWKPLMRRDLEMDSLNSLRCANGASRHPAEERRPCISRGGSMARIGARSEKVGRAKFHVLPMR